MKSKKVIYWLCGLVIVMSIGLGLYVHFELQPLQSPQYRITEIELINALGGKPALWLCIGIVIAVTFFRAQKSQKAANICLGLGAIIILAYCGMLVFYCTGSYVSQLIWISKNAGVFIIPGILIGVSFGSKLS